MKRPSWNPGEGKIKASRQNSCTPKSSHCKTGVGEDGRLWVRPLKVLSQTGQADVNLTPQRGREQGMAPQACPAFPPTMEDWIHT